MASRVATIRTARAAPPHSISTRVPVRLPALDPAIPVYLTSRTACLSALISTVSYSFPSIPVCFTSLPAFLSAIPVYPTSRTARLPAGAPVIPVSTADLQACVPARAPVIPAGAPVIPTRAEWYTASTAQIQIITPRSGNTDI